MFRPPTLIATFYRTNFTNVPELSWEDGFLVTTLLALVAALIPLGYIRRKGWLRWPLSFQPQFTKVRRRRRLTCTRRAWTGAR